MAEAPAGSDAGAVVAPPAAPRLGATADGVGDDPTLVDGSIGAAVRLADVLSPEEMKPFMARSDGRATWMVLANLGLIAVAFALPVLWTNPLTVLASLVLLGARQLGLAVIYHDCAHGVLFRTRPLNDLVGHWLAGGLLNTSMYAYRAYHLKHHQFAGTSGDPDLPLANAYPTSRASLKRKLTRDLTGQTGWKALKSQALRFRPRKNLPFLASHVALFAILWAAGAPWAYALWWLSYVFVHQLVTRLRFIGEHGVALDRLSADARENTCTTVVSWWERLLVAPNYVNFHLEHHLSAAVPCYRLPSLHRLLESRGFFEGRRCLSRGYRDVLARAITPAPAVPAPA